MADGMLNNANGIAGTNGSVANDAIDEITNPQGLNDDDAADDADGAADDAANSAGKEEGSESEVYGSPENYDYSEVQMPEGMELDTEMLDKFNPLAKKYNLSNKSANELLNLAVEMQQKNMAKFGDIASQIQENEKNSYLQLLTTDEELNKKTDEEYSQYLSTANLGLKNFATDGFKKLLKEKGLVNHPEFIKTFHQVGKFCQGDTPPNVNKPAEKALDAADILYGSRE